MKSKPRIWVLFRDRNSEELYISKQSGTPLYSLQKLPHFVEAFRSIEEAEKEAIKRYSQNIERTLERMQSIHNQATRLRGES